MTALADAPISYRSALPESLVVDALRAGITGRVIAPGDPDFDTARFGRNTSFDRRPLAIVQPADAADVARTVVAARSIGVDIAVRGGGHSLAGHSTIEGGILLDLRSLRGIELDLDRHLVHAGGGATAGELTAAAHEHGYAVPFGDTASVGLGGLTLGGGIGWLVRKHGLTVDSLVAVELVTADGDIITASETEHPDLFWALRGGGGNFGVATRFTYRLSEVGMVTGGALIYAPTAETLARLVDLADKAPDDLTMITMVMACPPLPMVPPEVHGQLLIFALFVHAGDPADAGAAYAPFRALGPVADAIGPMPYPAIYALTEAASAPVDGEVVRSTFRDDLDADAAQVVMDFMAQAPSPESVIQVRVLGGAMARVPADATAFAHREAKVLIAVMAAYSGEPAPFVGWVTELAAALTLPAAGVYANFLEDEGPARLHAAYPAGAYERLLAAKRRWDPSNVFNRTQNIRPI